MKKFVLMIGLLLLCFTPLYIHSNQAEAAESTEPTESAEPTEPTEPTVSKSGWEFEENNWYYYINNNKATGWVLTGSTWYYLQPETGIMSTGWVEYNHKWYFLNQSGAMQTGWSLVNNKWYFLNQSGAMQTGWSLVNNKWYFLNQSGVMQTGWSLVNNKWYFLNKTGAMQTGWSLVNNKWYYLNPSGDMKIGWLYQGGKWYYLKPDGDMAVGWFVANNKHYYTYSSGIMAANTKIGKYYVGYSGQWIQDTTTPYYLQGVLLVNKHHGLPSNYGTGENPGARFAYEQMKSAAAKQGYTLNIASGYRSFEYQKGLYWRYVNLYGQAEANRFSAYPGYSEHQTGLAFDIGGSNSSTWVNEGFDHTPEAKWLAKNAHHYGFILRYPPGKEHITGYMYESWHFRFLGVDLATKVYNSGLTLEEYLGEY